MPSAVSMIKDALTGFGTPAPAGSGDVWSFPNEEARDLAGKIFGAGPLMPEQYQIILSMNAFHPVLSISLIPFE